PRGGGKALRAQGALVGAAESARPRRHPQGLVRRHWLAARGIPPEADVERTVGAMKTIRMCEDCEDRPASEDSRNLCENCWAKRAARWAWSCWRTRVLPIHMLGGCSSRWSVGSWEDEPSWSRPRPKARPAYR